MAVTLRDIMKLRLPPRLQKILGQAIGFLVIVSSTLFANWLWQKYTNGIDVENAMQEERNHFLVVIHKVIEETEYNCSAGIGDTKCPFKLEAHHELLATTLKDCLPKSTRELIKEIIRQGTLCNGGRTGRKINSATVKTQCLSLQEELQQVIKSKTFAGM